jgi:serine protease inhibitor
MNFSSFAPLDWVNTAHPQVIPGEIPTIPKPIVAINPQSVLLDTISIRLMSVPNSIVSPLGFKTVLELLFEILPDTIPGALREKLFREDYRVQNINSPSLIFDSFNIITFLTNIQVNTSSFDFALQVGDPVHDAGTVNKFINNKTRGLIKGSITPGDINSMVTMINIIYFLGVWKYSFDPSATFNSAWNNDSRNQVQYMKLSDRDFAYSCDANFQVMELPYINTDFVFGIALPNSNARPIDQIGAKAIEAAINSRKNVIKVDTLQIPKFSSRYTIPNEQISQAFGLKPFTKCTQELYVSIDEKGTEAAVVTKAMLLDGRSKPKNEFIINRAFVYYIKCISRNSVIFVGRVDQPPNV